MDINLDDTRDADDREAEEYVDKPPPLSLKTSQEERACLDSHIFLLIHSISFHTGASKRQRCTRSMSSSMCGNTLASISSPTLANVGSLECPMDCVKLTILEPACI